MEVMNDTFASHPVEGPLLNRRRLLVLALSLGLVAFLGGSQYGRNMQQSLFRGQASQDGLDKSRLSWKDSFRTQADNLGLTSEYPHVTVEELNDAKKKKKPRHFHLHVKDKSADSEEIAAALSKALKSGHNDEESIEQAVEENLKNRKRKKDDDVVVLERAPRYHHHKPRDSVQLYAKDDSDESKDAAEFLPQTLKSGEGHHDDDESTPKNGQDEMPKGEMSLVDDVILERAPKHHRPRSFRLRVEDDSADSDEIATALSQALVSGHDSPDSISKAVEENLVKNRKHKEKFIPLEDKP